LPQSGVRADSTSPILRFSVAPEPSHLQRARERLRDYLRLHCADEDIVSDVVLCLEEACTNAIRHSGNDDEMQIELRFEGNELRCQVTDHGKGFDIDAFDPEAQPDILAPGGRGLFLIAQLMDEMSLRVDGGLEVHMRKRGVARCKVQPLESGLGDLGSAGEYDHRDARLRAMLEEIDEAFVALDWEYRYVHVNEAMLRLTQTSRDELLGRVIWELFPQLQGTALQERYAQAMELGIPSIFEHRAVVTGDWLEIRVYPTSVGISAYYRQVNQRKQAETQLLESEERFRLLHDTMLQGVVYQEADGTIIAMNPAAERILGKRPEDFLGSTSVAVEHESLREDGSPFPGLEHPAMVALRTRKPVPDVLMQVYNPREARYRLINTQAVPLFRSGEDKPYRVYTVFDDVTERRRAEQRTRESQALLQAVMDGSPDPIFVKDTESRMLLANAALLQMWGRPAEEVIGKSDRELYEDPAIAESVIENDRAVMESGQGQVLEEIVQTRDGLRTYLSAKSPYRDEKGEIVGVLGIARDITERKQVEKALRESEESFRSLFESITEGVALHEVIYEGGRAVDYRILDANPAFEGQTGMRAELARGRLASEFYGTGEAPYLREYAHVAESGEPYSFETYFAPMERHFQITAVSPAKGRFATVFQDITQRKQAEQELQHLLEESQAQSEELQAQSEELQAQSEELQSQSEELQVQSEELRTANEELLDRQETITHESGLRSRLVAIGDALHSTLNVEDVMGLALREATVVLGLDAAAIELDEKDTWPVCYAEGFPPLCLGSPLGADPVIARLVAASRKVLVLDHATGHEKVGRVARRYGIRSLIAVPLLARDQVIGILLLADRQKPRHFTAPEIDFAHGLGSTVAMAIENARLFEAKEDELNRTAILREVAAAAAGTSDQRELSAQMLDACRRRLGAKAGNVYVIDRKAGMLRASALFGFPEVLMPQLERMELDEARASARSYLKNEVVTHDSPDLPNGISERAKAAEASQDRWVTVPIRARDDVVGSLGLIFPGQRTFGAEEVALYQALADQLGVGLDKARLFEAEAAARREAAQELETTTFLLEAADELNKWTDLDVLLDRLADIALRATLHSRVHVAVLSDDRSHVTFRASRGEDAVPSGTVVPLDQLSAAMQEALATGRTRTFETVKLADRERGLLKEGIRGRPALAVPIVFGGRIVGHIAVDDPTEMRQFTDREVAIYEGIAAEASVAIENARLFEAERSAQQQSAQDLETSQLLLEAAHALNSWTDLDELLNGLADVVLRSTSHTRAYVALLAEDRSHATFVTTVGKDPLPARTILGWNQLSPVLQDALTDGRRRIVDFNELSPEQHGIADSLDSRLALHVPIVFAGRVLGHIAIDDPGERREFTDREIAIVEGIASQAAAAIENARLYGEQQHIATTLQQSLMHPLPQIPGLELAMRSLPANQAELVGGDFSDVFFTEDGRVAVLIGDVAGKGVRAAGLTETVRSTVRAFSDIDSGPAFILRKTNELLQRHESGEPHVTACLCLVDPATGHISVASAGHPAPIHLSSRSCQVMDLAFGPPLGSFPHDYGASHVMLTLDDYLMLYTDGVTEARRGAELFGEARLLEAVEALRGGTAEEMAQGIADAALGFGQLRDDLQVVVLRLS
jgi:PAS domain S-box-containing protein